MEPSLDELCRYTKKVHKAIIKSINIRANLVVFREQKFNRDFFNVGFSVLLIFSFIHLHKLAVSRALVRLCYISISLIDRNNYLLIPPKQEIIE